MEIANSNILTAFDAVTHGSKVLSKVGFMHELIIAINKYEFPENGQGFIPMPNALGTVSCGAARRVNLKTAEAYHIVEHRGEIMLAAHRKFAAVVTDLHAVVYTKEAYLADPQIEPEEFERIDETMYPIDYVLVAVIASAGPSPVSSHRFVRNLAGGNSKYFPENGYTIEQAIKEAKETVEYSQGWVTVSDVQEIKPSKVLPKEGDIVCICGAVGINNICPFDAGIKDKETKCTCCFSCYAACREEI